MSVQNWDDFEVWLSRLNGLTLVQLADLCSILESEAGHNVYWRSGDRKPEKLEKLKVGLRYIKGHNLFREYQRIRTIGETRYPQTIVRREPVRPMPTFGGVPARPYVANPASSWQRAPATGNIYTPKLEDWRSTPCWKPIKALTQMEVLTDITIQDTAHAKREKRISFSLSPDDCVLLSRPSPKHRVRLFCTSSLHYRPPGSMGFATYANVKLPIDYPSTPEFDINGHLLPFTQRGLRNRAGSAPPFDLQSGPRGITPTAGKLWAVTLRHTGPSLNPKKKEEAKRFYFQLVLVEWQDKEDLLRRVDALPVTDVATSLAMIKSNQDDEIEAGSIKMSLKDPYSYMKVSRPVRSKLCKHQRCFDATWWIEQNVTHPEWLCPLCNKELNFGDLMVDGYFKSIQERVDDDVEEVVIEDNGDWHTEDGKMGSDEWIKVNGPKEVTRSPSPVKKRKAVMILSDSEDDGTPSKRTRTPSAVPQQGVIDLTLSDDDDDPPARAGPSRNTIESPPPPPRIRLLLPPRDLSPADSYQHPEYQLDALYDEEW